ncbi:MAG: aminotransferase class IV [Rickettsiaceae bacterium]|nr:aminotransferase class IV [Rickettsiaceae bacterium]
MTKNSNFPLENLDSYIWLDGEFILSRDAHVHILNHSLQYGGGVFEGLRSFKGRIFKLEEHTKRLFSSANIMGLDIPYSEEYINEIHYKLLELNNLSNAYFRPFVFRATDSIKIFPENPRTRVMISAWESAPRAAKNIKLNISNWIKPGKNMFPPKCKASAQYGLLSTIAADAKSKGFDDSILLDENGFIAECTSCNIFFIKEDKIFTPSTNYCLDGITRQTIMQIADKIGLECFVLDISPQDLGAFDSAFVSGTAAGIIEINSISYNNGLYNYLPNQYFKELNIEYKKLTGENNE